MNSNRAASRILVYLVAINVPVNITMGVALLEDIPPQTWIFWGCLGLPAKCTGWPFFWYVIFRWDPSWIELSSVQITSDSWRSPSATRSRHHVILFSLFTSVIKDIGVLYVPSLQCCLKHIWKLLSNHAMKLPRCKHWACFHCFVHKPEVLICQQPPSWRSLQVSYRVGLVVLF